MERGRSGWDEEKIGALLPRVGRYRVSRGVGSRVQYAVFSFTGQRSRWRELCLCLCLCLDSSVSLGKRCVAILRSRPGDWQDEIKKSLDKLKEHDV